MDQLTVDVLIDILSRLPIKALMICSCVSKSFLNLTRDPRVAQAHLSRSPSPLSSPNLLLHGLIGGHRDKIYFLEQNQQALDEDNYYTLTELQFAIPGFNDFRVVGSCHGLLCLAITLFRTQIYVCNPFIRQYVRLPDPISLSPHDEMVIGFGFCDKTHEYKVVEVVHRKIFIGLQTKYSKVFVFTLGDDQCWRDKGDVPYAVKRESNLFVNGALHWVCSFPADVILSFDVGDEVFSVIPCPEFGPDSPEKGFFSLRVLKGCLSIVGSSFFRNILAEIWLMLDYGVKESWAKCFELHNNSDVELGKAQLVEAHMKYEIWILISW